MAARFAVDFLDLYAEDFDPRMRPADEPDWADPGKEYPPEVRRHMRRIEEADHLVVVFPVWWSAPPAILKGWIERTWTHGFAYTRSGSDLTVRTMTWLGLAGTSQVAFVKAGLDQHLDRQLRVEISEFCRIPEARTRFVYDSVDAADPHVRAVIWRTVDGVIDEVIAGAS
ncbi:hypothetical protein AVL48_27495 [Amycolatopsis regifaucium]|uniref:Flavodoxin-like fold domain-containing protein n=1 Tax=Amycolatopsis regifaucium TaxID=546365 RepID=A0A154MNW2_9PSEU|nr:NAD(P)H-dependent oxidoreductase [Amycolatopsis regifaucium]KZB85955.1 hypothetical protein AVL48_27495 [Amycolatopsis regifaucium]OKA04845.1 hypothetical protein ATP06_0227550 [Amycolatopsis regifaucium]SFH72761.1 Putative NADPH-quinone reductase (modulator of drug activity B) [Amycolatopsis regifaucium]